LAKKISADPLPLAVEALLRAAADPRPLKLHGTKASPGIFLSNTPLAKSAAKRCLENGWLESTGEFVGKGKTAKETYRVTAAGIDFALNNAPEAQLLRDLLAAADGQQQTLRNLADTLDRTRRAAEAQNKLLLDLKQKKRPWFEAKPSPIHRMATGFTKSWTTFATIAAIIRTVLVRLPSSIEESPNRRG
jgi:hypothetical protein